ncbi:peptide-methionine (R)-S-oxide reductase MsrB [Bizionia myxarmorum]|uniref:peptide-methionine (R)-S-oxide reductase n=1 Tax=Bizionia myxarmorum TaxID=291186 RepID=A0A5D0RFL3_9FLAO|nr:peptide-methionine (R)-S-oxide reductase MsrB [Bizionia myxarmorum]TYB79849.1 peptide-methionine (R)-S-oxide reductase MsrB [Bizionia myxarmorum]
MKYFLSVVLVSLLFSCNSSAQKNDTKKSQVFPISKTEAEWKKELTAEQFYVMREAGTERAFSSPLDKNYKKGTYVCAACETPLYLSDHKFDSGTGWPSFDRVIEGNVDFGTDNDLGFSRNEEHCANCGAHLGHVFDDGPGDTTGKRHCINGTSLKFIPEA